MATTPPQTPQAPQAIQTTPARVPRMVEYDLTMRVYWVLNDGPASLDGIEKRLEVLHDRLGYHHLSDQRFFAVALEELREMGLVRVDGAGYWSAVRLANDAPPYRSLPAVDPDRPNTPCRTCGGRGYVGPYDVDCPTCAGTQHDEFRELARLFVAAYKSQGDPARGSSLWNVWFQACRLLGLSEKTGEPS